MGKYFKDKAFPLKLFNLSHMVRISITAKDSKTKTTMPPYANHGYMGK